MLNRFRLWCRARSIASVIGAQLELAGENFREGKESLFGPDRPHPVHPGTQNGNSIARIASLPFFPTGLVGG